MSAIATPKAVFKAANELHASGQAVTNDAVIAKIQGGSKSTVGPLLEAWHSMPKADVEAIPASLEARARELAAVIWHEAKCKANGRIVQAQREFDTELQARDAVVEHTLEPIRALEAEVQHLQSALGSEQATSANLRAHIQKTAEGNQPCPECVEHERLRTKLQAENAVLREQLALFAPRRKHRPKARSATRNRKQPPINSN